MPAGGVAIRSAALASASALIITTGLSGVPGLSPLQRAVEPLATVSGLEQNWSMFAPEPRRVGVSVDAIVQWSDGRQTLWRVPENAPLFGAYRDYRWRKWLEHAGADAEAASLWRPAALYILRTMPRRPAAEPVELRVFRSFRPLAAPGVHDHSRWVRSEVYRAQLASPAR